MDKIDLKKDLKHLYNASPKEIDIVDVPKMNFLMIDGRGDPNGSREFQEAIETLYGVSFTLKFMVKKSATPVDYAVMPLEGLWWSDDPKGFALQDKAGWRWTAMIVQPDRVTPELVADAVRQLEEKRNPAALAKLRFESFHEGRAAQVMHVGPYAAEGPTIEKLLDFIKEKGYKPTGKHHEIYLGDPRRSASEKLRTIIRQPIR